jgi:hypothetical protein
MDDLLRGLENFLRIILAILIFVFVVGGMFGAPICAFIPYDKCSLGELSKTIQILIRMGFIFWTVLAWSIRCMNI